MKETIVVRGGGDIATGTIYKLHKSGFRVVVLETSNPSAIRRNVAFSEAVYEGKQTVEGVTCYLVNTVEEANALLDMGQLPLLIDPSGKSIQKLQPFAVVDGILAKKNLGTTRDMAQLTIGLGPGFTASEDVDIVVETMRGHNLGRLIYKGQAIKDTKIPGNIGGYTTERVIHAPTDGVMHSICNITDIVTKGQEIAKIVNHEEQVPVYATLTGLLRGLLRDGYEVTKGFKIADIDPRIEEIDNCFLISDKARCIAGGVLEAIVAKLSQL